MALKIKHWLACGVAFAALPTVALAQSHGNVETVTVTGSRVISDAANSPTPLTVVSTDDLKAMTPTSIPDGLNKLPVFQGSGMVGRPGDGSHNYSSNTLNLRNFGAQRTLVLLDGHRAHALERRRHGRRRHPAADADFTGGCRHRRRSAPSMAPTR